MSPKFSPVLSLCATLLFVGCGPSVSFEGLEDDTSFSFKNASWFVIHHDYGDGVTVDTVTVTVSDASDPCETMETNQNALVDYQTELATIDWTSDTACDDMKAAYQGVVDSFPTDITSMMEIYLYDSAANAGFGEYYVDIDEGTYDAESSTSDVHFDLSLVSYDSNPYQAELDALDEDCNTEGDDIPMYTALDLWVDLDGDGTMEVVADGEETLEVTLTDVELSAVDNEGLVEDDSSVSITEASFSADLCEIDVEWFD